MLMMKGGRKRNGGGRIRDGRRMDERTKETILLDLMGRALSLTHSLTLSSRFFFLVVGFGFGVGDLLSRLAFRGRGLRASRFFLRWFINH